MVYDVLHPALNQAARTITPTTPIGSPATSNAPIADREPANLQTMVCDEPAISLVATSTPAATTTDGPEATTDVLDTPAPPDDQGEDENRATLAAAFHTSATSILPPQSQGRVINATEAVNVILDRDPAAAPTPAQSVLGEAYHNTEATIRCIVASTDTFSPPVKYDSKTGSPVLMTPDDADAAQGWVPGISDGGQYKPLHLSTHQRTRLMGNAINAHTW